MWTTPCMSILSYCPTWDIGRTSRDSHVYHSHVNPMCLSCPTVPHGTYVGRTSQGFPCVPLTCQSYVSILSYYPTWDIGRTSQEFPCVPLTCQSYVSILSYCPTWDIGRTSRDSHVDHSLYVYPVLLSHMGHR